MRIEIEAATEELKWLSKISLTYDYCLGLRDEDI